MRPVLVALVVAVVSVFRSRMALHLEVLALRHQLAKSTVEKYMVRRRKPPSPTWRASLINHVQDLVSVDFFTVAVETSVVLA